jgi:hypothetical protein
MVVFPPDAAFTCHDICHDTNSDAQAARRLSWTWFRKTQNYNLLARNCADNRQCRHVEFLAQRDTDCVQ